MVDALIQAWLPRLERQSPRLVSLLLASLIGVECLRIALTLLGGDPSPSLPPALTRGKAQTQRHAGIDATQIASAHLFGLAKNSSQEPDQAPLSTSSLVLVGTIATQTRSHGIGIISADGLTKVFKVGDDVGGASLQYVYLDRVVLDRSGQLETLALPRSRLLDGHAANAPRPPSASSAAGRGRQNPKSIGNAVLARESVDTQTGSLRGFLLHPSRNATAFYAAGLKQNDLVTGVNGSPLTGLDQQRGREVMNVMLASDRGTVTVVRNGQTLDVPIDTSSIDTGPSDTGSSDTSE